MQEEQIKQFITKSREKGVRDEDIVTYLKGKGVDLAKQSQPQSFTGSEKATFEATGKENLLTGGLKALGNLPRSSYELGKNVVSAVANPIDTAKALGGIVAGGAAKVGETLLEDTDFGQSLLQGAKDRGVALETDATTGKLKTKATPELQQFNSVLKFFGDRYGSLDKFKETAIEDPAGVMADIATVLTGGGAAVTKLGQVSNISRLATVGNNVQRVGALVDPINAVTGTVKATVNTGKYIKEGLSPTPTKAKALEEIAVAKTPSEVQSMETALGAIDNTGVKTNSELKTKFTEAKKELSTIVDNELSKDTNVYKVEDLLVPKKTKAGKEIKTDYITRALDGLDDLYTKLGDDVAKADIQDLKLKAQNEGMTRLEVNNLARQYNSEYGSKAFTATGDIKQGFNAELYESTRMGLKDIARGGLGGKEAAEADRLLSAVYDAEKIADRNTNAVQAMKTRIDEKGWVGKGIKTIWNTADLATGGAFRALRDTVLARGSAQKLQNVLELESKLRKNLDAVTIAMNKVANAKTEAEAIKATSELKKLLPLLESASNALKESSPKK